MTHPAAGPRPPADTANAPAPAIGRPVWRLAWVIVTGAFLSGLDASVTNVGLDSIGTALGAGLSRVQWVTNGYLVAFAVSLPLCGWLGKRVGPGRLWLAGLAVFTLASGLCALAPGVNALIVLRVCQGLAAGLLIPAGQTVLGQAVGVARLGRVMSTVGFAVSVAPAVGPVVGGLVLDALSWRWLFLINLPIGAVGLLLGRRLVPRDRPADGAPPLDRAGLAAVSGGLPLLVYALTMWGSAGTLADARVLPPLLLGLAAMTAFVLRTLHSRYPVTDLRLYRDPVYAAAGAAALTSGALLFGTGLVFPLYFQMLQHTGVIETGLRLLSLGGGTALVLPLSGRMVDRFGGGAVAGCGGLLAVAVTLTFALLDTDGGPLAVQVLLLVFGAAVGLLAVPPGIASYKRVPPDRLPDATTQVNIVQRVGGAVGGALFAVVLAAQLPSETRQAFHTVFWWLAGTSTAALVCALVLHVALRHHGGFGEQALGTRPGVRKEAEQCSTTN